MIGVVIPAHDEEALIGRCLAGLRVAARHPALHGEAVEILVVLDHCSDRTAEIVAAAGVAALAVAARSVGVARATGASALIARGARWLAFTDADSEVAPDWLASQLEAASDAVCGVVSVGDWGEHDDEIRIRYEAGYVDAEHHRHVHGASMGVSAEAYLRVGGFQPLRCSEDVALIRQLADAGAAIRWTNRVRVRTSARRVARAPGGFATHLALLSEPGRLPD
jgi:glycosyltransferase involved in cell wall biosynthesis